MVISTLYWQAKFARYHMRRQWCEWETFASLSAERQQSILGGRLLAQLKYFAAKPGALPEWQMAAHEANEGNIWDIWPSLPVLTKRDLQQTFNAARIKALYGVDGIISATGGSTGEPTTYLHDKAMVDAVAAAQIHCWRKFGWTPGLPVLCLWGSQRDIGASDSLRGRLLQPLERARFIDGFRFDGASVDQALTYLEHSPRVAIYGYTSLLDAFARALKQRGSPVPAGKVIAAWNGGEPVAPDVSKRFQAVFGVPIQDLYGSREFGAIAYKPDGETSYTLFRPSMFLEVLGKDNRPVPPGQVGRVVLTSTVNRGTPFLRYEMGDLATYAPEHDGPAGLTNIETVAGRLTGVIELPDGRVVHNIFWNHLFKEFDGVRAFQVVKLADGGLSIRLQGQGMTPDEQARLTTSVNGMFDTLPWHLEWVESLPRTREGKLLQVVQE